MICNRIVETWEEEDDGYEFRTRNRKVVIPHTDNYRIEAPEETFSVTVCIECLHKDPSLKSYVDKARIDWYTDKMDLENEEITRMRREIKERQEEIKNSLRSIKQLEIERAKLVMELGAVIK